MAETNTITFTNPDGTPKSKDQFVEEMGALYDRYKNIMDELEPNLFDVCTKADSQIDPEAALKTFRFIDKSYSINDEITQDTAKELIELIRFWNEVDIDDDAPDPIIVYINSPGGELDATLSIIAAIELSKTPVYTVNLGRAYSGGFFILIAGHKRFAAPYSSYLFHEGATVIGGDAHKSLQAADFYKHQLNVLKNLVLDKTNIDLALYDKHKKDDWWFDNKDAKKYNIIDDVITSFNFIEEEETVDD